MSRAHVAFGLGVVCLSLVGFLCPWWFLGFAPLGAGLVWAAYDIDLDAEDAGGDVAAAPRR